MKKTTLAGILAALFFGVSSLMAQTQTIDVDRTKYPDYSDKVNPDWSLMRPMGEAAATARDRAVSGRPDHVHNGQNRHFPPVFNQDGGSCGSASRISYMFSYELAAYRNLDGSDPHNHYPSHFVWLHTNSPAQGKDEFVTRVGVPSAATYGGQTYSSLFGNQAESNNDFGWMQGYDKWYEAMNNRMLKPSNFPVSVGTEEGREAVKNWLWNHNGDDSFAAGGICGIGVASSGNWQDIPKTATNEKIGVAGMKYVKAWGTQVDHALTIVGYDDRIEFDLDGDGVYGEPEADELGAWIIVNSWGPWWCNGGFIYCPYAHAVPNFNADGTHGSNYWQPEIYKVRKDYRPMRTIKLEMDYSRRSEIALSAGVSADLNATEPESMIPFIHFTYAGDGNGGNSNPAPEIPMLGRWADGKLHTEPMEFGYDLTDLSANYDMSQPLKYFFIVDSRSWALGEGTIHKASIIDYSLSELGVETPFALGEGVEVKNAGEKTIISVIVQGSGYGKPQNVAFADGTITWQAPVRSGSTITGYNIYYNDALVASLAADARSYTPQSVPAMGEYGVSAVYSDGAESGRSVTRIPTGLSVQNVGIHYNHAGFTIPNVLTNRYEEATIEFWIKPSSLQYWNQSGGAGLSTFFFYATQYGQYFAGWDNYDGDGGYVSTYNAPLQVGKWSHVAIVVNKNQMSLYVDGTRLGTCTSSKYSGLGGFGDLVFAASDVIAPNGAQHAAYDEVRVWNVARTQSELKACMKTEFTGSVMPQGLIAYLKGETFVDGEGNIRLYDYAGTHHATLQGSYDVVSTAAIGLSEASEAPAISINAPQGVVYAGIPATFSATYNTSVSRIVWTAEDAGVENLAMVKPALTFAAPGTYTVTATAYADSGETQTATCTVNVVAAPEVDATFTMTHSRVSAGEPVTFHAHNPQVGYIYQWSMPGADVEEGAQPSMVASYSVKGSYAVTLTVTAPDGTVKSHSAQIEVAEVAPKAAFSVMPAVVIAGDMVDLTDESLYTPTQWTWHVGSDRFNHLAFDQYKTLQINQSGVYDVTLSVANGAGSSKLSRQRALIVTNADSKNGLLFSSDKATVKLAMSPVSAGQSNFTIEWWMNSAWPSTYCNGIGESDETLLVKTNADGQMMLYVGGNSVASGADFVVPGEWHHYAVILSGRTVRFYRDCVLNATQTLASGTTIPAIGTFSIGTAEAPFKGSVDEMRIWSRALSETALRNYANEPIIDVESCENSGLKLYYDFNQSGGDVKDATSNNYHGVRSGFGPDGDAWGLSRGVFCLNFDEEALHDITSYNLTNYQKTFAEGGSSVNPNSTNRFRSLSGWTLENVVVNGSFTTGAHVDRNKESCFTVTTGWDGFANVLSDHKAFQTITLPEGYYTFTAEYGVGWEGQCGGSYLVAAVGNTLPETANLSEALAYTAMKDNGKVAANSVGFVLTEETTVSVGLLVNMSGQSCMTLQRFSLVRSMMFYHEKSSDALPAISKLSNDRLYYISLPHHTGGLTSWAIAQGGSTLKSNTDLGIAPDRDDTAQQFAFLSNDEGATHYLYHAAEKMFVNKEGALTDAPTDPVYFVEGAYDTTFVVYFDEAHYINVGGSRQMVVDDYSTPDGGNSVIIRPAKTFNPKAALAKFPVVEVEGISLSHSSATLMAGEALALQATIAPSYATDPTVTWTSSNASVAIVTRGVVTAVAPGEAIITAKAGDKEATCVVTVEKRYVEVWGLVLSHSTASVSAGDQLTIVATVTPDDADDKTVTWETSDASIATVENGVVTALVPGTVTITAKAGNRQATCEVTVKKRYIPVTDIILNYTELNLEVGQKVTLSATVLPDDADNKVLSWTSSNVKVATISSRRQVTAKAAGTAIITAETADHSVTCVVTVWDKLPDGIDQVEREEKTLEVYDIVGRPLKLQVKSVEDLDPGIYIINGRKTVVK